MKIAMIGTGYVGLVSGVCFSDFGHNVVCVDKDANKIANLKQGKVPIFEPGLDMLMAKNVDAGRLTFTVDLRSAIEGADAVFIAVGTPPNEDGSADLGYVLAVAQEIGEKMQQPIVVADKSTVPVGTADKVRATIQSALEQRGVEIDFDVVSNPEFLREGSAVKDFMYPDRIVVGTDQPRSQRVMEELYDAFAKKENRLQFVGVRDAEMIKYAANAMLATKISFMNEVALMCDEFGIDVENVRRGIGTDPRIGPSFIYPGCGYGGSCFPKDVRAMAHMANQAGLDNTIFDAVERRNERQQLVLIRSTEKGLMMHALFYADEVRSFDEIELDDHVEPKPAELELARQLIEQLAGERFDPSRYEDDYRRAVLEAIEKKVAGEEVVIAPVGEPREQIIDLMAALKKSLAEKRGGTERKPARAKGPRGRKKSASG